MRILCFHGFRTNANIMKIQMTQYIRDFPEHEFVFLNGLIETNQTYDEVEFYFGKQSKYYEWYNDEITLKKCTDYFRTFDFNFDMYIGFSQGASVCSMLISNGFIQNAILIAHGKYIPTTIQEQKRTLHLIGLQDPYREYGEKALEVYKDAICHRFNDHHKIPTDSVTINIVKQFISTL